ncbi:MAG: hypothetical protein CENE_02537 [Candidatus Celerinatantimonas neptuna]|nr:MAG: hypothetical protein CENE_02537 [Candidatus Celerinatantimonas neptuna]
MIQLSKAIYALLFATFTNYIGFVVPMFLSLYLHKDGQSLAVIGYTLTAYGLGGFIGGFTGGLLSDKISPYLIITSSLLVSIVVLLGIYISNGIISLLVLLLIFGFSDHSFRPAFTIMLVNNSSSDKRTFILGIRSTVMNISIGLSAAIGGLIFGYNMKFIFLFDALFNIITLIFLILVREEICRNIHPQKQISNNKYSSQDKNKIFENAKPILILSGLLLANVIVFSQFKTTFVLYLKESFLFSAKTISYLFILNTLIVVLFEVPIISLTSKLNQIKVMLIGSAALCIGYSLVALYKSQITPFLSVLIWTCGEMIFFPIILNEFIKNSTTNRGKIVGWHQTLFATGSFLGAPVGIFLYKFNNGNLLWLCCGILGAASFLAIPFFGSLVSNPSKVKNTSQSIRLPK